MSDTVSEKKNQPTTVQAMVDEVKELHKPKESEAEFPHPSLKPAELDQDPGGGYNANHSYPQT